METYDEKSKQESRCCFSAEIDKDGHILKSGSWLNCCNICITLTLYGWDMAQNRVVIRKPVQYVLESYENIYFLTESAKTNRN